MARSNPESEPPPDYRRHMMGLIAFALLLAGAAFAFGWSVPAGSQSASGAMIKIGLMLGAIWLAWPQIDHFLAKTPRWLLAVSLGCLVLIVMKPVLFFVVLPLLAGLWFFGPRLATKADQLMFGPNPAGRKKSKPRERRD